MKISTLRRRPPAGAADIDTASAPRRDDDRLVHNGPAIEGETAVDSVADVGCARSNPAAGMDDGGAISLEPPPWRNRRWRARPRSVPAALLIGLLAFTLAGTAGWLTFYCHFATATAAARQSALTAASDAAVAMLSYRSDNVEQSLPAARERLTGNLREVYSHLITDVVIPGAKDGKVTSTAKVVATAAVSARPDRVVTVLYIDQHATVGGQPPVDTATAVRVTMRNVDNRWLVEGFDPI